VSAANTPTSVFISVGTTYRSEQEVFLDALMALLEECDVKPRVIERTDFATGSPLKHISKVLSECDGAIIIAFERKYFNGGVEKRNSPDEQLLPETRFPTPWNQIEAAMAYQLGLPLLVFAERGLRQEGLLEEKYDWHVERVDINADAFSRKEVRARIQAWCREMKDRAKAAEDLKPPKKKIDDNVTLAELFGTLSLKTAAQIVIVLGAVFSAGLFVGRMVPASPSAPSQVVR
jgi:hypothetical protein